MPTQTISRPYCAPSVPTLARQPNPELYVSEFTTPQRLRPVRGLLMGCALVTPFWVAVYFAVSQFAR